MLPCNHPCRGTVKEDRCMVCLEPECIESMPENKRPKNKKDDYCPICYSASITQEPSVSLNCGHIFHASCIKD